MLSKKAAWFSTCDDCIPLQTHFTSLFDVDSHDVPMKRPVDLSFISWRSLNVWSWLVLPLACVEEGMMCGWCVDYVWMMCGWCVNDHLQPGHAWRIQNMSHSLFCFSTTLFVFIFVYMHINTKHNATFDEWQNSNENPTCRRAAAHMLLQNWAVYMHCLLGLSWVLSCSLWKKASVKWIQCKCMHSRISALLDVPYPVCCSPTVNMNTLRHSQRKHVMSRKSALDVYLTEIQEMLFYSQQTSISISLSVLSRKDQISFQEGPYFSEP